MHTRNYTIDLLRLVAASAVVLFHLNCKTSDPNTYQKITNFGWLGVPVFFVISGFCIAMAANGSKSISDFFVRRFFRIFPAYWFSLLIVLAVVGFQFFYTGTNSVAVLPKSFTEISATFTLLTHPFSSVKTINGVYWSLTVEIFFYLIIGLSLLKSKRFQYVFLLIVSILALFPSFWKVSLLFFLSDWAAFGIGFALYLMHNRKIPPIVGWSLILINVYSLLFNKEVEYSLVALGTLFIISLSIFWKDLPKNFLSKLGDYSYSIYLIHGPVSILIHTIFNSSQIHKNILGNILWDLAILLFVSLCSSLIFKYVELPSINLGRIASKRLNSIKPRLDLIKSTAIANSVITPIENKESV